MMKGKFLGLAIGALALGTPNMVNAGVLVASGDEWTLSDYAYDTPYQPATTALVQDLSKTFGGTNYLLLVGNTNVRASSLNGFINQLTTLGISVETSESFSLSAASGYDAVFHFGQYFDASQLADLGTYLSNGGNAYVSLGGGWYGTAAGEAATWNPFLAGYGLEAGSTWFSGQGFENATVAYGPEGATNLNWGYGQSIEPIAGSAAVSYVRGSFANGPENIGLIGSSRPLGVSAVPEPMTWTMMILGFGLIGVVARRRPQTQHFAGA